MIPLRHSTANQFVSLGYVVSNIDADTELTQSIVSILNSNIKLFKSGTNTVANKNGGAATAISGGIWGMTLDGVDTDTVGPMDIYAKATSVLGMRREAMVFSRSVYDALIAGTGNLNVNSQFWRGSLLNALIAGRVDSNIGAAQTALQAIATSVASAAVASIQNTLALASQSSTIESKLASTLNANVSINSVILADVARWRGQTVLVPNITGEPIVDLAHWRGSSVNELISGKVDAAASAGGTVTVSSILGGVINSSVFSPGALWNSVFAANAIDTRSASVLNANVQAWLGSTVNALIAGRVDVSVGAVGTPLSATVSSILDGVITTRAIGVGAFTSSVFGANSINGTAIAPNAIGASQLSTQGVAKIQSNLATVQQVGSVLTVDVARWSGQSVASPNITGRPLVDVTHWQGSAVNALISGKVDASASLGGNVTVSSILAGAIDASALNASATSAIQSGLARTAQIASTLSANVADKSGFSLSDAGAASVLQRALSESYAADGSAMTAEQALHMIWAMVANKSVAGVTLTAKKLDGTTTAMQFTLDSATSPTSIDRSS